MGSPVFELGLLDMDTSEQSLRVLTTPKREYTRHSSDLISPFFSLPFIRRSHHIGGLGSGKELLTNFPSSVLHSLPLLSYRFRFKSVRLLFNASYVANWIDPLETPTRAKREPLYRPRIPSRVYIVRNAATHTRQYCQTMKPRSKWPIDQAIDQTRPVQMTRGGIQSTRSEEKREYDRLPTE